MTLMLLFPHLNALQYFSLQARLRQEVEGKKAFERKEFCTAFFQLLDFQRFSDGVFVG